MAEYVVVENGQITEYYGALPVSWRHISGLNLLKDDIPRLISFGWYPVVKIGVNCNPDTHITNGYSYEIFDQYVTETPIIIPLPPDQIITFEKKKEAFLADLRYRRNEMLKESDWTQLVDCVLSNELRQQWATYRQALRDLPQLYKDNEIIDINLVIWPTL